MEKYHVSYNECFDKDQVTNLENVKINVDKIKLTPIPKDKSVIIHTFLGYINNVSVNDEKTYYSVNYLLPYFPNTYNEKFIEDFISLMENIYYKNDDIIATSEIEKELVYCLKNKKKLEDIKLDLFGNEWQFEWFNENLKNGVYTKKEDR